MLLVRLKDICVKYGLHPLLDQVNITIDSNEKIALIGRNGAGKSTLLKLIKGLINPDSGSVEYGSGIKIGMLEQDFKDIKSDSIFEIVASGLGKAGELVSTYHQLVLEAQSGCDKALHKMQIIQQKIDDANAWDIQNQVDTVISKLNINPELEFNSLSGGLKRRVLLAKALVQHPDLLLLDEPTNHLDIESINWLESLLANWKTSVLIISHDREFVRKVATRVIELDRGFLSDWPGNYDNFLQKKEEALHREELENKRFDKKLANEEVWIRQGVKARRTRNEGRVRALKKMREERKQRQDLQGKVKVQVQDGQVSGKKVIEATNITHSYFVNDTKKIIIKDFSTLIMRGDKIALVGPNGCGKTTLINILLKNIEPTHGSVTHGTKIEIAYFDQLREELDNNLSVRDNVAGGSDTVSINGQNKHVIGYLQDFLFTPERANSPISVLSGGERNRLLLAKLFTKPSNLFVLDEPTNDLDIETLELLEYLLVSYAGTVLLISHDREFINNIASSTIVFEGNGVVQEYIGDYTDYLRQRDEGNTNKKITPINKDYQKEKNQPKSISKLNYQEKKELEQLPKLIEKLENKISELQSITLEPGFYQQESKKVNTVLDELKKNQQDLDDAYKRWEALER